MATVVASVVVLSADLEPPDMIAHLDPVEQPCLGQFGEVAVDRRTIEAPVGERGRHVGVRPGPLGSLEMLENRQPGRRAPQAGRADARSASLAVWSSCTRHAPESTGIGSLPLRPPFEHPHDGRFRSSRPGRRGNRPNASFWGRFHPRRNAA